MYADSTQLKAAKKVWFTEDLRLKECTRFTDASVEAYIGLISNNKFSPASTLRFAKLEDYLQVAIPFPMLDKMEICGKCFPKPEAETMKSQYPRINWKQGSYVGSNVMQKRDDLGARAPATCPVKAKPSASASASPKPKATPPSKPKATPPLKPNGSKPTTPRPKGPKARTTF